MDSHISIQISSDLHLECIDDNDIDPLKYITPTADILILAGDIGSLYKLQQLTNFLTKLSPYFQTIIYVPGNHEYYYLVNDTTKLSYNILDTRLFDLGKSITNLYILNRDSVRINNLCIAGCTLWSNPECNIPKFIVRIHEINTSKYIQQHQKDLKYITSIMDHCKQKGYDLLMITHHPPTNSVMQNTNKTKKFRSLYSTNLDHLLDEKLVKTWICGHIHKNFDFITEKGCRIVSNQRGKPKDHITDYNPAFTIIL
jgi:predicted phosphohydrolase